MPLSKIVEASTDSGLYYAKAWVNFNGTGTVAIRASGNVSSITDNGTGDYTVNFTNAMPDTNYAVSSLASNEGSSNIAFPCFAGPSGSGGQTRANYQATGFFRVFMNDPANFTARADKETVVCSVFR